MACPPTPAVISGEAVGFELTRLDPKDEKRVERVKQLISESKSLQPSICPGNPVEDLVEEDNVHKEHRVYIVTDLEAGVIGYCSLTISKDVYVDKDGKKVKLVYVESSCSFTTSLSLVGGKTVRDIIGAKGGPRVGRYIKEAIALELCMEYEVDIVILISFYVKTALPAHLKNGARTFDAASIAYLNSLAPEKNVLERLGTNLFFGNLFLDAVDDPDHGVKSMLLKEGIYVAYPPLPGGGRRRKTRRKTRKRRSSRRR